MLKELGISRDDCFNSRLIKVADYDEKVFCTIVVNKAMTLVAFW